MGGAIRILVVEDSVTQSQRLQFVLGRRGFGVQVARDGVEALTMLERELPRMVITDVVMPRMDGYELCERIKMSDRLQHLPVILLTSLSDLKDVLRGLESSADGFMVKPYDEEHLLARVSYILDNEEVRAQHSRSSRGLELFFGGESHFLARLPKVEKTIDLLLGAYETVVQKNAALQTAKGSADEASQAKSAFLSSMSHELRTPLNAILGFGQLLELEETDESKRESLAHILAAGRHLLELANEVVDIARIEARRLNLTLEALDARDIVLEVVPLLAPLAAVSKIDLAELPEEKDLPPVLADRQRLRQVLLNLISNAIKYNREGGRVTVWCERVDSTVRVIVSDTGIGISPEKLPRLFVPFDRLDTACDIPGAGLGLVITKGLVEAMGGTIAVESTPGSGTTFLVDLPAAARPTAPPAASPERNILCIEDDALVVKLIEELLESRPELRLTVAMAGARGLEKLRAGIQFDLILLDYHLPDMKGHELFRELQRDPRTAAIPVVVMSGDGPEQVKRAFAIELPNYLRKPFGQQEFLSVIEAALAQGESLPLSARPGFL